MMGCCLGRSGSSESDDMENAITIGKNRPLIQERIKWKSDVPMTEGQLRSKRDEFWETAPAFDGRKEIWDALRAAAALAEQGDYALSQAILDGANISLPDGTLRESYDELGNRYQVPYYCLSAPTNLVEEHSSESSGCTGDGLNGALNSLDRPGSSNAGESMTLKLRLSTTGEDVTVDCHTRETVHLVKQRLHQTVDTIPIANQQRWFYGGRVLMDKMRIADCRIPQNFVVQVVLHSNNNAKLAQEQSKQDTQIHSNPIDTPSAIVDEPISVTKHHEMNADNHSAEIVIVNSKSHIRPSSITSSMKDAISTSTPLPGSANENSECTGTGGRRTGSSSSRKNHGKQHVRKMRSHHSTTTTTSSASNGAQQRCNSFTSKPSAESPTPVETS